MSKNDEHSDLSKKFEGFEFEPTERVWNDVLAAKNRSASPNAPGALSQKYNSYHVVPSSGVWERIENKLYPKKRARVAYWSFAASIAFLFGGVLLWQMNTSSTQYKLNLSSAINTSNSFNSRTGIAKVNEFETRCIRLQKIENFSWQDQKNQLSHGNALEVIVPQNTSPEPQNNVLLDAEKDSNYALQHPFYFEKSSLKIDYAIPHKIDTLIAMSVAMNPINVDLPTDNFNKKFKKESFIAANITPTFGYHNYGNSTPLFASQQRLSSTISTNLSTQNLESVGWVPYYDSNNLVDHILPTHSFKLPISFEIDAGFYFKKKWKALAGVQFSLFRVKRELLKDSYSYEQNVAYKHFSIPLFIQYDLVQKRKIHLYSQFGIINDLIFSSKSNTQSNFPRQQINSETNNPWQVKLNLALQLDLGFKYLLNKKWNASIETGFKYYPSYVQGIRFEFYNMFGDFTPMPHIRLGVNYNF